MKKKIYSVILSIAMVLSSVDSSMYVHASKAVTGTAVTEQEVTASKNTPSANVSTADVTSGEKDTNDGKDTLVNNESSKESQDVNGPVAVYSDLSSDDDSVIEISSESDLLALVEQGKSEIITGSYILTEDISLTTSNWIGIGSSYDYCFAGEFDGNGHTISGIKTSGNDYVGGLFGYSTGIIKNLTVKGSLIDGKSYAGILCGYNDGTIQSCTASGSINSTANRGGLVGYNNSNGQILECSANVKIEGDTNNSAGGLVGSNHGTIKYSYAAGNVSGNNYVGGLAGYNGSSGNITCSYTSETVTGNNGSYVAGFVGDNDGNITYSYARGSVNSGSGSGFARGNAEQIFYSYYNSVNTGNKVGFAESTVRLKKQDTYYGWDFAHVWTMGEDGYPCISLRGEAEEVEIKGSGAEDDPYIIENESQLFALASNQLPVNGKKYYQLGNDIEITADNWTPIGNYNRPFNGVFDGAGHVVTGLKSAGTAYDYIGLFGYNVGTVKNLTVNGSLTDGDGDVGILCGYNDGTIQSCTASGSINSTANRGGLVGYNNSNGQILECSANVKIEGDTNNSAGGLVGSNHGTIKYSYAAGNVSGNNYVGGLAGYNGSSGNITCSYTSETVTGNNGSYVAGFVGDNDGNITYSYARGSVNSGSGSGFARGNAEQIFYSYYNSVNTGNKVGFAESTVRLKKQDTYYGWDFAHVWTMGEDGYPCISLRGEAEEVEIKGSGAEDDPYIIENESQLFALASNQLPVNGKKYYQLGNDIEITADNWTPIGNYNRPFNGVFDGAGHVVTGLKSAGTAYDYIGLFGYNVGTIKNLTVSGEITKGSNNYAGLLCAYNQGTVDNCSTEGSVNSTNYKGGLIGWNEGVISNSKSDITIIGNGGSTGGLVGKNTKRISTSFVTGKIYGNQYVGGLAGENSGTIENTYSNVAVNGASYIGGLIGYQQNAGSVVNSYSTGNVTAENSYCYGGLIGSNYGTVASSYYNKNRSGCEDTDKGTPLTNMQMKDESNFEDWDFVNIWGVYDTINNGFPFLQVMSSDYEDENLDFWYSVKESKKGYALTDQTMNIYYNTDAENTVKFIVNYIDAEAADASKEIEAFYDKEKRVFMGSFAIADGMKEITSVKAVISGEEEKEVAFSSSFWYQMPLKIEGIMNVKFNSDIIESTDMTLKVFKGSRCVFKSKLDGEATDIIHSLAEGSDYRVTALGNGIEYASVDDITVIQGQQITVDFTDVPKMASLNVEFDSEGTEVSNKGLKVVFYDKTIGKSRLLGEGTSLNYLSEGDVIGYSLALSNELAKTYKMDRTVNLTTLKAGENTVKVELKRFQNTDITGVIYESDGETVVPGVKVTAVQQLNGIHSTTFSGSTDATGTINLTGKDVSTTITLSKNGYTTTSFEVEEGELDHFTHQIERTQGRIQFGISYIQSTEETETELSEEYNLVPDKISIYNESQDIEISNTQINWPNVYIGTKQAKVGDVLNVTINKQGYEEAVLKTTVLDNGNAYVTGSIYQYGGMNLNVLREDGIVSDKNHIMVFDEKGVKLSYKKGVVSKCQIKNMQQGTYTVICSDESVPINLYNSLEELENNTDIEGLYSSKLVEVTKGVISVCDMDVPLTGDQNVYLDKENTSISLNNKNAMIGDSIVVRAAVAFKANAKRENTKIILNIPAGTRLVDNSLTIDGKNADIEVKDNTLTLSGDSKTTVIRYRVKVLSTITSRVLEFTGKTSYTIDGKEYINSIGTDTLDINELTLIAPKKSRTNTIMARGIADRNASITIYDGDVVVGNVTANKYGVYRVEISLDSDKGMVHYLRAVNKDTKEESEVARVTCGSTQTSVSSFKIIHNGTTYDAGDPSVEVRNLNITMVPSAKFEFIATFTDDEIALVQTEITLTNGNVEVVDMEYNDAMGYWHGEITLDSSRVPSAFSIGYLPTKYSHDYSNGGSLEMEASESEVVLEKHYDDTDKEYVQIIKHQFDVADSENNEVYEMTLLEDDAEFELSDEYLLTQIDGQDVYVNKYEIYGKYDGVDYSGFESYYKQDDGSYVRYIRAYGVELGSSKMKVRALADDSDANGEKKEGKISKFFKELFKESRKKVEEKVEEKVLENLDLKEEKSAMAKVKTAIDFLQKQTSLINKSKDDGEVKRAAKSYQDRMKVIMENGGPVAKTKASIYYHELEAYVFLEQASKGIDWCAVISDQSIDLDTASFGDKMLYKKVITKTDKEIKKKLDENYNAMKELARSQIDKQFSALIKAISEDKDLLNALKELEKTYTKARTRGGSSLGGQDEEGDELLTSQKVSTAKVSVDPSGYVYETFEDNRIQGVTATLYYENDAGDMEVWDAEEYNQKNPLITDNDGNYAWDVPEGLWQVVYTKEGYETVYSEKMIVPPPQLDVNIAMVSTEPAHISKVTNLGDKLKITFDKYLLVDSILKDSIQLSQSGDNIDTKLVINKNNIRMYNDQQVTKYVELQIQDGIFEKDQIYDVMLKEGIETYAGVPVGKDMIQYVADSAAKPINITIPDGVRVYLEDSEITAEDGLYQNDRIKISADVLDGYRIASLKVNEKEIENDSYVTVGNEDIVITVSYQKISDGTEYLVRFDSDGGTAVSRQYVAEGEKVQEPGAPQKEGYIFVGWYLGDDEYNFENGVTKNIILKAKWIAETEVTVSPAPSQSPGSVITPIPTEPTEITASPEPSDDINVVISPSPTKTPGVMASSKPTRVPAGTMKPVMSKEPTVSDTPIPNVTEEPDETVNPGVTNEPIITSDPKTTQDPNGMVTVNTTARPNVTATPNITVNPKKKDAVKTGTVLRDEQGTTYKVIKEKEVEYTSPDNDSVTKIVVPDTVTIDDVEYKVVSVSKQAFSGCSKLKTVTFGKNVISIGDKAFYNCKLLVKIVIPARVVKIGKQAFASCKRLKFITIKTSKLTMNSVGAKAFKGIYKKPVVKVPKNKKKAYKKLLKAKGLPGGAKFK